MTAGVVLAVEVVARTVRLSGSSGRRPRSTDDISPLSMGFAVGFTVRVVRVVLAVL